MTPLVPPGRLVGLDVARALALVGMIATHVLVATRPDGSVTSVQAIAGGRASALFAVLAGVSLALMSGRATPLRGRELSGARAGLFVRALFIAFVGLVLGELDTTIAVILTYYGVLFVLGLPFLGLGARPLAALAVFWAVGAPVVSHLVRPSLTDPSYASPSFTSLAAPQQLLGELLLTGYYPAFVWLAYLFAGMSLGRLDLARPVAAFGVGLFGAATASVAWLVSEGLLAWEGVQEALQRTLTGPASGAPLADALTQGTYGTTPTGSWWWLAVHAPHSGTPFDLFHTAGSALAVIGACLLLSRLAPRTFTVLFGAGAMTLTLYSLHVFLRTDEVWPSDDTGTLLLHVVVVLVVGAAYRLARRSGPLERVAAVLAGSARRRVAGEEATAPTAVRR